MSFLPLQLLTRRITRRAACAGLSLLALALCLGAGALDDPAVDESKAIKVKAAFLLNFVRFTEWPQSAFATAEAPLVIGIVGDDPFGAVLDKTVEGKTAGTRSIRIIRLAGTGPTKAAAAQLGECHLLFIARSESTRFKEHVAAVAGAATLTVSDSAGFSMAGGMIELGLSDGKVTFSVNRKAAEAAGLKLSAKLLQLGKLVEGKPS